MPSLMESIISLDVGAQEPWPNDVQLFQPYPMEQILLPDNANCLATQAYLHMCGLPFKIEHRSNAEFMSPSGKVPFIKCGAFVVSELEPIVQFVANKGISLTEDFDNEQKSDLRAYMSLIFSVLMNAELYICWCDKRTYNEVTKVRNGSVYPWPLNHYQNWTKRSAVIKKLKLLNWYQKTLGSVYQEVETCCQALSERLEGKEYFFGSKPTEVDALLYGHTYSIFSNPVDFQSLFVIFQRFPNLIIHCKRISLHYTFLRYIDFTKTDTDLELSRNSSIHNLLEETKTKATIFTRIWNHVTRKMCSKLCINKVAASELKIDKNTVASNPEVNTYICFKKSVMPSCVQYNSPFEGDSAAMNSINYLGHKVIQQHIQQDLRNKLSDITIDTNSDLWSEKDLCYSISDRDLKRNSYGNVVIDRPPNFLMNKGDMLFGSNGDGDDNKHHLENKSSSSGSGNSICCNTSEQLDWIHRSSQSSIDIQFSNKCDTDSYTKNKNNTLDEQENIHDDVDVDVNIENKSVCNAASEIDWITDDTSDNELNNEIVITFKSMDNDSQVIVNKYSNCSIDHDSIKERQSIMEMTNHSIDLNREDNAYNLKSKLIKNANADAVCRLSERNSTISNTGAWTTTESFSEFNSVNTLAIDNNESVVLLMNDMINSVEQMNISKRTQNKNKSSIEKQKPITKSGSETIIETYSDNHICDENCNITYAANDYSLWDDDLYSKTIQDGEKGLVPIEFAVDNQMLAEHSSDMKMSEPTRMIEGKVIDKISNESLKKYFSCESRKQAILNHIENNDSRSSIIEEYSMERLSNVTVAVEQRYSQNEFLKLLKSDSLQCELSTSTSNIRNSSTHTLHNCDELTFEHSVHNSSISEIENSSPPKARVFRKCRRLLNNKLKEIADANMHSDSKILQMYNEKLIEHRIKSNEDIENIRTACIMLKNFNTKPEPCAACSLCKFSSNPSISSSCKCCDSTLKLKSKSVSMFSSVSAVPSDQLNNPH